MPEGYISPTDRKTNISFKIVDVDDNDQEIKVSDEIMSALKAEGNLVFIHPDSLSN